MLGHYLFIHFFIHFFERVKIENDYCGKVSGLSIQSCLSNYIWKNIALFNIKQIYL